MAISSTMWIPLLPALTAKHYVRMLDTVGHVNKSVATAVMSSSTQVISGSTSPSPGSESSAACLWGIIR